MGNLLACCSGHTGEKLEEEGREGREEEGRRAVDEEEGKKAEVPPLEANR